MTLAAVADPAGGLDGVPSFASLEEMLEAEELDVVSVCTPPQMRHGVALTALRAGRHVLLEKPPAATLAEVDHLVSVSEAAGLTLFATWHSRFAAAVEPARAWLAGRRVRKAEIVWKEDVKRWHPGQAWIWEPGGLGVFDPAINAFSIVTHILPEPFFITASTLRFPSNCRAPISGSLDFRSASGATMTAELDFEQEGPQTWDIEVETDNGTLKIGLGGRKLWIDGELTVDEADAEYAAIYRRLADLVTSRASDVDLAPFRHVADAFMLARMETVGPFHDPARATL